MFPFEESDWPWVNFANILRAALTRGDPESAKKTIYLTVFFALSGSACVKAARKLLVKFTPDVNFINVLRANFLYEFFAKAKM